MARLAALVGALALLLLGPAPAWTQESVGTVSIEFVGGTYTGLEEPEPGLAIEGNTLVFRVIRSGTDRREAFGTLQYTNPRDRSVDYSVTIAQGATSTEFRVGTAEDAWRWVGDPRTATVSVSSVVIMNRTILGGTPTVLATYDVSATAGSVTVEVADDDASVTARLYDTSNTTYLEGETDTIAVVLTRNGDVSRELTAILEPSSTRVERWSGSFAANSATTTANVTLNDDSIRQDDETVTLTVEHPVEGRRTYRKGNPGEVQFAVTDDDLPVVSVAAGPPGFNQFRVTEGSPALFTVSRDGTTAEDLEVTVEVTSGLQQFVADAPSSWSRTLTIASGDESAEVEVPTQNDEFDEVDGPITLEVTPDDHYVVDSARASASVTVGDNDLPVITITTSQTQVAEGGRLDQTLIRSRTEDLRSLWVTVSTRVDPNGSQRTSTSRVTFAAGVTEVTRSIEVPDDEVFGVYASVEAFMGGAQRSYFDPVGSIRVPVDDDDPVRVSVTPVATIIWESDACAEFRIRFDNVDATADLIERVPGVRRIVVPFAVTAAGEVLAGSPPTELALSRGTDPGSHRTVCVPIGDDSISEPTGSVTLTLRETGSDAPADHAVIRLREGGSATARVYVSDDDLPVLALAPTQESVEEGESAIFVLTRDGGDLVSALEVEVYIVQNPGDRHRRTLTVSFPRGETSVRFVVPTRVDPTPVYSPSHHVEVAVTAVKGRDYDGTAVARLPVVDRDPVRVFLTRHVAQVSEAVPEVSFTTYLEASENFHLPSAYQGWRDREVTFEVAISQEGDFLAADAVRSYTITLNDGTRSAGMTVPLDDDAVAEPDGRVSARILPNDSILIDGSGQVAIVVTDDDEYDGGDPDTGAPEVTVVAVSKPPVTEGADVQFSVWADRVLSSPLTVYLNIEGHRKIMSAETRRLADGPGTIPDVGITIPAGIGFAGLTLTTENDRTNEGDGELTVTVAPSAGYRIGSESLDATVTVQDDDIPEVNIEWIEPALTLKNGIYSGSMIEGGDLRYRFVCTDGIEIGLGGLLPVVRHVENLNHPVYGYNKDIVQQGACGRVMALVHRATQRYVGPANGTISIRLLMADSPDALDHIEAFRGCRTEFCPRYELGTNKRVEIDVINRNPTIVVAAAEDTIDEGETARFILTRIWNNENLGDGYTTRVQLRVTDDAGYAVDMTPTEVTFKAGVTTLTVEIPTENDAVVEDAGDLVLELRPDDPANGVNIGGSYEIYDHLPGITPSGKNSKRASVRVVSEDATPGVTFDPPELRVVEGGTAHYTIALNSDPGAAVQGQISVPPSVDGGVSVSPLGPLFSASAWRTPLTITVTAAPDDDSDNNSYEVTHWLPSYLPGKYFHLRVIVTDDDVSSRTLDIRRISPPRVTEGDTVTATVTGELSVPLDEAVTVTLSVAGLESTEGEDFQAVPDFTLTIPAGAMEGSASFTVVTLQDDVAESGEALRLTGTTTAPGLTVSDGFIDLLDDDVRGVVVEPESVHLVEGSPGRYRVRLSSQPTGRVTVAAAVDGAAGDFLTVDPAALTFVAEDWNRSQTVTVRALADTDAEDEEATISHTAAGADYGAVTVPATPVYVLDSDSESMALVLSATPATVSESVGGTGGDVEVTAALDGGTLAEDLEVTVSVAGATATLDADFQAVSDLTLTVAAHTSSAVGTFRLSVVDDEIAEGDETLTMTGALTGVTGLKVEPATLTIADDDRRGVSVTPNLVVLQEGGTATYTVALRSQPTASVTVTPAVSGDADVTVSGAVVFTARDWRTTKTLTVSADQDDDLYDDEATVTHTVSGGDYDSVTTGEVTVSVTDDDQPPVTIAAVRGEIREGDSANFIVTRSDAAPELGVVVWVSENRHMLSRGQAGRRTVAFAAGVSTITIDVATDNDRRTEPPSTVTASLGYGSGYDIGSPGSASVNVSDDDQQLQFSLVLPIGPVDESAGTIRIPVTATADTDLQPSQFTRVALTSDAAQASEASGTFTAMTGEDLVLVSDLVIFFPSAFEAIQVDGETRYRAQANFYATVLDDEIDEEEETFPLILQWASGHLGTFDVRETTVTIIDDDATPAVAEGRAFEVEENQTAVAELAATDEDHDVDDLRWSIPAGEDGGADGGHFALTEGGELSFKAAKDYENPDDADADGVYDVTVQVSDGSNESTAEVTVTLVDVLSTVTIAAAEESVAEGAEAGFIVTRAGDLSGAQTVSVSVAQEGSVLESSVTGVREVAFADGAAALTLSVATVDDEVDEADGAVTVTVEEGSGYQAGAVRQATVAVRDDDEAGVQVAPTELAMPEGSSDTYEVVLRSQPEGEVTVTPGVPSGTDVTVSPASLTFTAEDWAEGRTVTVAAAPDPDGIADDAVAVTHAVSGYGELVETATVTVRIGEDETESLVLYPRTIRLTEGESGAFTVKLATQPAGLVTLAAQLQPLAPPLPEGMTVSPASLTFTTADWGIVQTVTVTTAHDDDAADPSRVFASFGIEGYRKTGPGYWVTYTITDDDTLGLAFSERSLAVLEGDTVGYTVALGTQPSAEVTVAVGVPAGTDVSVDETSLTFSTSNWKTAQTVTVTAEEDDDVATDPRVTLSHTAEGGDYDAVTGTVRVAITENDQPGLVASPTALTVTEGDANGASYAVHLATEPSVTVTVTVGGTEGTDLMVDNATLTFTTASWSTAQTVRVTAAEDDDADPDARVRLSHTAAGGDYEGITARPVSVSITENDEPPVTIEAGPGVTEGEAATFVVSRSDGAASLQYVGVQVSEDGSILRAGQAGPRTVVFGVGVSTTTIEVTTRNDRSYTGPTEVTAALEDGAGYAIGTPGSASVLVADDEMILEYSLVLPVGPIDESAGTLRVVMTATTPTDFEPPHPFGVVLTSEPGHALETPTAQSPDDYVPVNEIMVFRTGTFDAIEVEGETRYRAQAYFDVTIVDDDIDEEDEIFGLTLRMSPAFLATFGVEKTMVTITDEDATPAVAEVRAFEVDENQTAVAELAATDEDHDSGDLQWSIPAGEGGGADGGQFALTEGGALSFKAAKDYENPDDADGDGVYQVTVQVSDGSNEATAEVTVTLVDVLSTVEVAAAAESVEEGADAGFIVTRSDDLGGAQTVSVSVTEEGSVLESSVTATREVEFTAGAAALTLSVATVDDEVDEVDGAVTVTVEEGSGYQAGAVRQATVAVRDNDTVGLVVSRTELGVTEGDEAGESYTVALATEPSAQVTVAVSGDSGTDVEVSSSSLTFSTSDWKTEQTVTVKADDDEDAVVDAAVELTHEASGGDYGSVAATVTVRITESDTAGPELTLEFGAPKHTDADDTEDVTLGDELTYTATASNSGNVPLTGVVVSDLLVSTTGSECGDLAIGAECELSGSYTVSQEDVDAGKVANTATASATELGEDETETEETEVEQERELGLSKTAQTESYEGVGDELRYRYEVSNSGTVTLRGTVAISDDKIGSAGITCAAVPEGGLAPGGEVVCAGTYTVSQADVDAGSVTNEASATLNGVSSEEATERVPWIVRQGVNRPPGSELDPELNPRSTLTLGTGEFGEDVGEVALAVRLSPASEQTVQVGYATGDVTASAGEDYEETSGRLTFAPSETSKTILVEVRDDAKDELDESFTVELSEAVNATVGIGTATVTIEDNDTVGLVLSRTELGVTEGDEEGSSYTVALATEPSAEVTVTVGVPSGTDVEVTPSSLTFSTSDWKTEQTVTVTADDDEDAVVDAAVELTHEASGGDYGSVAATVTVRITESDTAGPELTLEFGAPKHTDADDTEDVTLGDELTYTATASNSGNVPLTGVVVSDLLVSTTGSECGDLAIGAECELSGSYTVSQEDVDAGKVANTATAAAAELGEDETETEETEVEQERELGLSKTAQTESYEGVGDELRYRYEVSNSGTVTLRGTVAISDDKIGSAGITCAAVPEGGLAPGGEVVCAGTYTVSQADVDAGSVTNEASATLDGVSSEEATERVPWIVRQGVNRPPGSELDPELNPRSTLTLGTGEFGEDVGEVALAVRLSPASEQTVQVGYATGDVTASAGEDYEETSGRLTFAPSETSKTILVEVSDDAKDELDESFTVELSEAVNATVGIGTATVTIEDNDTVGLLVNPTELEVGEGDADGESYTVALATEPSAQVTVAVSGDSGTDVEVSSSSLTFSTSDWKTEQTVTVTADDDEDAVVDAAVELTHEASGGDYGSVAATVTVRITESDTAGPELTLEFGAPKHTDADDTEDVTLGDELTYTATASNSGNVPLTGVVVSDLLVSTTGSECGDLAIGAECELSGSYTVSQEDVDAGKVANTATAAATELGEDETETVETEVEQERELGLSKTAQTESYEGVGDELRYRYEVSNSGTVTLSGTVAISDDKIGSAGITCAAVPEGGLAPGGEVVCAGTYTVSQADVDAGSVTNEASATLDEMSSEKATERVPWIVRQGVNRPPGSELDPELNPRSTLTLGTGEFGEDVGEVALAVRLSPASEQTVQVGYATGDVTASAGEDYEETSGRLTFAPSETSKTILVEVRDDAKDELDESFTVELSEAVNATVGIGTATVTIEDNDTVGLLVNPTELEVGEGDADGESYTVALATEPSAQVTVAVSGDSGTDVEVSSSSLTFSTSDWKTEQTVTVTADDDEDAVVDAAVELTHEASGGDYGSVAATVTVRITESDTAGPELTLEFGAPKHTDADDTEDVTLGDELTYTATASNSGNVPLTGVVVSDLLVSTTGSECGDLAIGAECELSGSYTVSQEDVDAGKVANTATASATELGEDETETVETEVEQERELGLSKTAQTESYEGVGDELRYRYEVSNSGTVTLRGTVAISDDKIGSAGITCAAVPEGGLAPGGEVVCAGTYTVSQADVDAGSVTNEASATLDEMSSEEATERVPWIVRQGVNRPPGSELDPELNPRSTLTLGTGEFGEDVGEVALAVRLSPASEQTVQVGYATGDVTASAGEDYEETSGRLTFAPSETSKTILVEVRDDAKDELDESFTVELSEAVNATVGIGTATVTIEDNDTVGLVVNPTELEVGEGDADGESYTVALATEPSAQVTVAVSGDSGTDVEVSSSSLTFSTSDWKTEQTVTVTADDDEDAVVDAAVELTHEASGGDYGSVAATVTVRITESDTAGPELTLEFGAPKHTDADDTEDVTLGDELTYTATASNSGNVPLTGVVVSDLLVSTTGSECGDLAIGAECELSGSYTVSQEDVDAGKVANTATASATELGEDETETVETEVEQERELGLSKTAQTESYEGVGDELRYRYEVSNSGTVTLRGTVAISDDKIGSAGITCAAVPEGGLAPGGEVVCAGTYTVSQADVDAGSVTNEASATLDEMSSEEATERVPWIVRQGVNRPPGSELDPELNPRSTLTLGTGEFGEDVGEVALAVRLSPASEQTVQVGYATGDVTASAGEDYEETSGRLTFAPSETSKTILVEVRDDAKDELDESFTVELSEAVNATVGIGTATVRILDNDTVGLVLSRTELGVTEGDDEGESYTVELATEPSAEVTVTVGVPSGTDVEVTPSSLTFSTSDWKTEQTVTVTADDDEDAVTDAKVTVTNTGSGGDYGSVAATVTVRITESDEPGLVLSRTELGVAEGDDEGSSYTVALATEPSAEVTVTVGVPSGTDVEVSPSSLTFSTSDWKTEQTVTVTADDDEDAVTDAKVTVTNTGSGGDYGSVAATVTVRITESDEPGLVLSRTELGVTEGDDEGSSYTVALATEPSAEVTVTVGVPSGTDVEVSPSSLTFSTSSWGTEQTVTVTADDDEDAVTDAKVTVTNTGSGGDYGSVAATVTVRITESDEPGLVLSRTELGVTEGDDEGSSYTVALATEPSAEVTVTVGVPSGTDVEVSPSSLTFSTSSWGTEQTVTVTADDDEDAVTDAKVTVTNTGSGGDYGSVAATVTVRITESDEPGLVLSRTELGVAEGDDEGSSYTVALATEPSAEVTVTVGVPSGTDVEVSPSSLTFSTSSWGTEQTVTVTADDDEDAVTDAKVTVTNTGSGGDYGSVAATVTVRITESDEPGLVLSRTELGVTEGDDEGSSYTVALATEPSAEVTVTVGVPDGTDVGVTPSSLTFSTSDWKTEQTVTVTADDDEDAVTDAKVTVTNTGSGGDYGSVAATVTVRITESDEPGLVLSRTELGVTEGDDEGSSYTVALATEPSAEVTVTVGVPSGTDVEVSPSSLTFSTSSWGTEQTVTVTADDDEDAVTDAKVTVTNTGSGGDYGSVAATVTVRITESDEPGLVLSRTELGVTEGDDEGSSYTVALATEPSAEVTVTVGVPDGTDVGVTPSSLTFSTSDWKTEQTVTVTADDDEDAVTDAKVTVTNTGSGGDYGSVAATVTVRITESDEPGLVLSRTELGVTEGDDEGSSYTVALATEPSAEVTVTVGVPSGTDVEVSPSSLTFSTSSWGTEQTVTVTADDDEDAVTDAKVTVTNTGSGGDYGSVAATVTVRITESDEPGLVLSRTELGVTEGDDEGSSYTVALATEPSAEVTVTVGVPSGTDVEVSPSSLTFSTSSWGTEQTVTVTADDDEDAVTDAKVTVTNTGSGGDYGSVAATVTVRITESDEPGLVLSRTELGVTEGDDEGSSYTVALATEPSAEVTVTVGVPSGTDVEVSPSSLTFSTSSWGTEQTVTVTADDDEDAVTDAKVTVTNTGSGGDYGSVAATVTVRITESDEPGLVLSRTELGVAEGDDEGSSYTVELATEPSAEVTVTVGVPDGTDVGVTPSSLTFSTSDWKTEQTVTVTATEDAEPDAVVELTNTGSGGDYGSVAATVTVTITETDTVGLVVNPTELTVAEGDADGESYTVALATEPSAEVTVTVGVPSGTDVEVSPSSLTFSTSDWKTEQTVTVTATEDAVADAAVELTHEATGGDYGSVAATVTVTITETDTVGLVVNPTELTVAEGDADGESYTVALATEPSAEVTVTVGVPSGTDVEVTPSSLTFSTSDWKTEQTVTVTATEDAEPDAVVELTNTGSGGDYESATASVTVTIEENDTESASTPTTVALSVSPGEVPEDAEPTAVEVTGTLIGGTRSTATEVTIAVSGGTATAVTDFAAVSDVALTVAVGATSGTATFMLAPVDDAVDERDETVVLSGTSTAAGVTVSATSVTIVDDDEPDHSTSRTPDPPPRIGGDVPPEPEPVIVTIAADAESVDEGENASFTVRRTGDTAEPLTVGVSVSEQGEFIAGVPPTTVTFATNATTATLIVATEDDATDEPDGSVTATLSGGDGYELGHGTSATQAITDNDEPPDVTIADASVVERVGEIAFAVRLSAASGHRVTVKCTSADGTALAGEDYAAELGTLTIAPGQTTGTIKVAVIDDTRAEADESFEMVLSEAANATLERDTATGTIMDDDAALQEVWLSRFGRTVATHVMEAVGARLAEGADRGSQVTVAGRRLEAAAGEQEAPDLFARGGLRELQPSALLAGSSFEATAAAGEQESTPPWSVWGRGALTQLAAQAGEVSLSSGSVGTGTVGADYDGGWILGGLAAAYSGGGSEFRVDGTGNRAERSGQVESWLVSAHPYVRVEVTDGLAAWGLLGYGLGGMAITDAESRIEVDTQMLMGAYAVRGVLLTLPAHDGIGVAVKTDGFLVRMSTRGEPAVVEADASRLRLVLEGSGNADLGPAGSLSPSLELGLRHDAGDAEKGFGAELGGGLRYVNAEWGLTVTANGRLLVAHEARGYQEWGASGSIRWVPGGGSGRGPQLSVSSSWGAESGGVDRLWTVGGAADLVGTATSTGGRLSAELGYGVTALAGEALLTPYAGVELTDQDTRAYRVGSRFAVGQQASLSIQAQRRERLAAAPEHELSLSCSLRW